jgi:hypothetical protein
LLDLTLGCGLDVSSSIDGGADRWWQNGSNRLD